MASLRANAPVLLLLVAILAGGGGWNYYRNLQAEIEAQKGRKFGSYAEADLVAMRGAYRGERDDWADRYDAVKDERVALEDARSVEGNAAQFAQARTLGNRKRAVNTEVGVRDARLREINREITFRKRQRGFDAHWRRLTTFQ